MTIHSPAPEAPAPDPLALLRHAARGQPLPDDLTFEEYRLLGSPTTARRLLAGRRTGLGKERRLGERGAGARRQVAPTEPDKEAHRHGLRPWLWLARVTITGGPTAEVLKAGEADVERAKRREDLDRAAGTELIPLTWSYESRMSRALVPGDWIVYA